MTKFSPLPHPGHLGSDYTPSLTGKRILIVDDSAALGYLGGDEIGERYRRTKSCTELNPSSLALRRH
jgi:hypothetical protein